MKLVNYVDYSKVRVINEKEVPNSYFVLEFDNDNGNAVKVLIQPVDKKDYNLLRRLALRVVKGK